MSEITLEFLLVLMFYYINARIIMKWVANKCKSLSKEKRDCLYFFLYPIAASLATFGFFATLIETSITMKIIDFIFK